MGRGSFDDNSPDGFDDFETQESTGEKPGKQPQAAKSAVSNDEDAINQMLNGTAKKQGLGNDEKKQEKKVRASSGKAKAKKTGENE